MRNLNSARITALAMLGFLAVGCPADFPTNTITVQGSSDIVCYLDGELQGNLPQTLNVPQGVYQLTFDGSDDSRTIAIPPQVTDNLRDAILETSDPFTDRTTVVYLVSSSGGSWVFGTAADAGRGAPSVGRLRPSSLSGAELSVSFGSYSAEVEYGSNGDAVFTDVILAVQ